METKKIAYESNFKYKGTEAYDIFILEVDKDANKEQELEVLKSKISYRYGIRPDRVEIYSAYKKNMKGIRVKDLTVEDFSLLFNISI